MTNPAPTGLDPLDPPGWMGARMSPPSDPVRWQPLLAAVLIVVLWANGLGALGAVLVPGAWIVQSTLIAALTLVPAGAMRTIWPHRLVSAVVVGLVVGFIPTVLVLRSTTGLAPWYTAPVTQFGEAAAAVRQGVAPLEVTPAMAAVVALTGLLLAWACVLMSAGSGDVTGSSGFVPAGALLIPGLVSGQSPPARSVLVAAVCLVLLVGSTAPAVGQYAVLPRRTRLCRAVARAGARACVLATALCLAASALWLAPTLPDRLRQPPGRPAADTPDTSLALNRDLVRGSAATAFDYDDTGFPENTSLRFTLAVVRDLDGSDWEPLATTEGVTTLSDPPTSSGPNALTAGGAVKAAAGADAPDSADSAASHESLPRVRVHVRALSSRRLPLLQATARVESAAESAGDGASESATAVEQPLSPTDWQWVVGTSTAISSGAETRPGTSFTAYGWSAVADATGRPQLAPPVAPATPSAELLAPYVAVPEQDRAVQDAATEAIETAGAAGADDATRAAALAAWFHGNGFVYDESAPGSFDGADGGNGASSAAASEGPTATVSAFLTERRGYCIHYAAAFTLMARSLGIPTRIAIGYASQAAGGDADADADATDAAARTFVSGQDLHAWPEVWIDDVGWVAFEPTPGGAGARADAAPAPSDSSSSASPTAPTGSRTDAAPSAPASSGAPGAPGVPGAPNGQAGSVEESGLRPVPLLLALIAAGALVLALPGALRWRQRRRRRRLVAVGGTPAGAAWEEVMATAVDLGLLGRPGGSPPIDEAADGPTGSLGMRPRARTPEAIAEYLSGFIADSGAGGAGAVDGAGAAGEAGGAVPQTRESGGSGRQSHRSPEAVGALGTLAAQVVAERFSLSAELPGQMGRECRMGHVNPSSPNERLHDLDLIRVALITSASRRRRLIALLAPKSVMPHRWRS